MIEKSNRRSYYKSNSFKKMGIATVVMAIISISMMSTGVSAGASESEVGIKSRFGGGDMKRDIKTKEVYAKKGDTDKVNRQVTETGVKVYPSGKSIIEVPYIDQSEGYPTGCEIVSTTMVLQYYGYDISVDRFIDNYLDKSLLEDVDGVLWGDNPNETFIGDPRSSYSYGCFAPVIVNSLNRIIYDGMKAKNTTGTSINKLIEEYIDKGIPVLLWATINLEPVSSGIEWNLRGTEDVYQWQGGEHCMVLVGYDDDSYYFNDPYDNHGLIAYERDLVEMRFLDMGMQSVVVSD